MQHNDQPLLLKHLILFLSSIKTPHYRYTTISKHKTVERSWLVSCAVRLEDLLKLRNITGHHLAVKALLHHEPTVFLSSDSWIETSTVPE